ncbi:hypothetical protein RYX36_032291, partial [Vicia faba]
MKPTYTQGRYKIVSRKNATPKVDYFDDDGYDNETFINIDASQRFTYYFCVVKELYDNLVDTNNKWVEVVVRGYKVSYLEGTINMFFKLGNHEDRYHELLTALDDADFDVYMESLCNIRNKWVESG